MNLDTKMIYTSNLLNERQLADLRHLSKECKQSDDSTPNLYFYLLEQPRALPANVTYYDLDRLVGFLSVYFFYDDAVEVGLLIHPSYRRKGIAKQLLQTIKPLLEVNHIAKLIFNNPSQKNSKWLKTLGFQYQHSEYHMTRSDLSPILMSQHALKFRTANTGDILDLCALDEACFPRKQPESIERFQNLLADRKYKVIVTLLDEVIIGKAHVRWDEKEVTFSDIAILPQYQGKGYGSTLIAHCINLALSEGKTMMNLDVETHNQKALELYKKLGFFTNNSCDYWNIPFKQLALMEPKTS